MNKQHATLRNGFTLIELLVVVAIIAILAAIALFNFSEAQERALRSADMANMRALGTALQMYHVDHGKFPPADRVAGPFASHTAASAGNGPAAGGSWDGVPWLLVDQGYVTDWKIMFCPRYLKKYQGPPTRKNPDLPRYHNFRYAYNSSAVGSGTTQGGHGDIESGTAWLLRDLWVPPNQGWDMAKYPAYPADYNFPWGPKRDHEHVMYIDMAVKLVKRNMTAADWTQDFPSEIP